MSFEEAEMGHCYHHALSSVKKWGGTAEDYLPLHQRFDESRAITADFRHRALRHHAEAIFVLELVFGPTITISTSRVVRIRLIGERHVREDVSFIPSLPIGCAASPFGELLKELKRSLEPVLATLALPEAGKGTEPGTGHLGASLWARPMIPLSSPMKPGMHFGVGGTAPTPLRIQPPCNTAAEVLATSSEASFHISPDVFLAFVEGVAALPGAEILLYVCVATTGLTAYAASVNLNIVLQVIQIAWQPVLISLISLRRRTWRSGGRRRRWCRPER
jgi:hypothetical protein